MEKYHFIHSKVFSFITIHSKVERVNGEKARVHSVHKIIYQLLVTSHQIFLNVQQYLKYNQIVL